MLGFWNIFHTKQIDSKGTNKVVWEDLNFSIVGASGPAVSVPDFVTINDVIHREFTSANNQFVGDTREIPHKAKLETEARPHAHFFLKSGESAGTTGVTFTVYWEVRSITSTTSGNDTISATSAELSGNANQIVKATSTTFTIPANANDDVGSQVALKIARTAGDAGDVVVTTFGYHYQIDQLGSYEITSKR